MAWNDSYAECLEMVKTTVPKELANIPEYEVFLKFLAYAAYRSHLTTEGMVDVYSLDGVGPEHLGNIANTLEVIYPSVVIDERLRLLLKYLKKIRRERGTVSSIKKLVRILEATEEEICSLDLVDYSSVSVILDEGVIEVSYSGILDSSFVEDMLKLVIPAGYSFQVVSVGE